MNFILIALVVLGGIALVAAVILYICSKKFAVHEDPRIGQVASVLPGAKSEIGLGCMDAALPVVQVWPTLSLRGQTVGQLRVCSVLSAVLP